MRMRSHFSAAAANEGGNNISTEANSALKSANMEDISTIDNRLDTNSEAIEANTEVMSVRLRGAERGLGAASVRIHQLLRHLVPMHLQYTPVWVTNVIYVWVKLNIRLGDKRNIRILAAHSAGVSSFYFWFELCVRYVLNASRGGAILIF